MELGAGMGRTLRVVKEFFWISLVATVVAATWGLYEGWAYYESVYSLYAENRQTYACLAMRSDQDLLAHTSEGHADASALCGMIGYPKIDAIREFRTTASNRSLAAMEHLLPPRWDFQAATYYAVSVFLLVNLLGVDIAGFVVVFRRVA